MNLSKLGLGSRTQGALERWFDAEDIPPSAEALAKLTQSQIAGIRGIGEKAMEEIVTRLQERAGLKVAGEETAVEPVAEQPPLAEPSGPGPCKCGSGYDDDGDGHCGCCVTVARKPVAPTAEEDPFGESAPVAAALAPRTFGSPRVQMEVRSQQVLTRMAEAEARAAFAAGASATDAGVAVVPEWIVASGSQSGIAVVAQSDVTEVEEFLVDLEPEPEVDPGPQPIPEEEAISASLFVAPEPEPAEDSTAGSPPEASALDALVDAAVPLLTSAEPAIPTVRASSLARAALCPGYPWLASALHAAEEEEEEESEESGNGFQEDGAEFMGVGTAGHLAMEHALRSGDPGCFAKVLEGAGHPELLPVLEEFWEYMIGTGYVTVGAGDSQIIEGEMRIDLVMSDGTQVMFVGHQDLVQWDGDMGSPVRVSDWKFYHRPQDLLDIHEDPQMASYGLGAALAAGAQSAAVYRWLNYQRRVDVVYMDAETLELAREMLQESVEDLWARRDEFIIGQHCMGCPVRTNCATFTAEAGRLVGGADLQNYSGGPLVAEEEVLQFLLAAKAAAALIKAGTEAAKAWVGKHGPVTDPVTGKVWGPGTRPTDVLAVPSLVVPQLVPLVGKEAALDCCKVSKSGIEGALMAAKKPPAARKAFLEGLRALGLLHAETGKPRWEWRKPETAKDAVE